ncbi:hypothetical protein GCM10010123_39120 [Pilimelia anulata]|uniref:Superoxide dismutase copper/zinc binding domain-containing protein n=1 Tax=Pilimelia anulata TaxID=53371 RepID=A0A8J3FFL3_9ACTN|nr:superoxide dismutase family protein [Pilimelia anulata]GGK05425.1 hypothetical protein GCM10010123_39120 [Pilimelia anulata]
MRRTAALMLLAIPALAGCAGDPADDPAATPSASSPSASPEPSPTTITGTLATPAAGATAVTYDPTLAPVGATLSAALAPSGTGLSVTLTVAGLKPSRPYGAHVHTAPCGMQGTDAGPHLQHTPDPKASASPPSVDPSFANPTNEVWLDVTTDTAGGGAVTATAPWRFTDAPRSIILHAEKTKTEPGKAGTAGARIACLTLPVPGMAPMTPTAPTPTATASPS